MAAICCEVDPARFSAARGAGEWVRAFYPHVAVTVTGDAAQLASASEEDEALRMIWRAALANEMLLARGAARRAGVIAGLVA